MDLAPFIDEDQPSRNYLRRNSISLPALTKLELEHLKTIREPVDEVRFAVASTSMNTTLSVLSKVNDKNLKNKNKPLNFTLVKGTPLIHP